MDNAFGSDPLRYKVGDEELVNVIKIMVIAIVIELVDPKVVPAVRRSVTENPVHKRGMNRGKEISAINECCGRPSFGSCTSLLFEGEEAMSLIIAVGKTVSATINGLGVSECIRTMRDREDSSTY